MVEPTRTPSPLPPDPPSDPVRRNNGPSGIPDTTDLEERWVLPSGALGQPCSIYVYGDCRPVVNGVAFAMADMLDLAPLWLEVRDPQDGHDEPTAGSAGWIPPDRLFLSDSGSGLEPNDAIANFALWNIVRSDEPGEVLADLTDFLRLPQMIQEVIGHATSESSPRAIVVANVERVQHLFPQEPGSLRRFLRSILNHSVSLVVAHTGPPGEQRSVFSAVFRVHASTLSAWKVGTLECEKGLMRGPYSVGRPRRLSGIPSVSRVLTGLQTIDR